MSILQPYPRTLMSISWGKSIREHRIKARIKEGCDFFNSDSHSSSNFSTHVWERFRSKIFLSLKFNILIISVKKKKLKFYDGKITWNQNFYGDLLRGVYFVFRLKINQFFSFRLPGGARCEFFTIRPVWIKYFMIVIKTHTHGIGYIRIL